jgi:hypothetical protein
MSMSTGTGSFDPEIACDRGDWAVFREVRLCLRIEYI